MTSKVDQDCPDCARTLMWIDNLRDRKGRPVGDQFRCANRLCPGNDVDRWYHRVGNGEIKRGKEPASGIPDNIESPGRPDYNVSGII